MIKNTENKPRIEKLDRLHDLDYFDCGQENLNNYLQRYALINHKGDAAKTYVGIANEKIIGYYTLVVSHVVYDDAPKRLSKGLSRNPVPVMLLARLAIDLEWQGKGVGSGLLRDAMQRTLQVADIVGVRSFLVHAKDAKAKAFYEHFDFISSKSFITSSLFSTSQLNVTFEFNFSAKGITLFFKASPRYVKASSAPCSDNFFAIPHAMERSFATPIIRPFFPFNNCDYDRRTLF